MKARILVIEDEMSINDLLCMNLEIAGYETVGYLDGNKAYEAIIQDHAFQCALVDIMLPGRDGYSLLPTDVYADVFQKDDGSHIPSVSLTVSRIELLGKAPLWL